MLKKAMGNPTITRATSLINFRSPWFWLVCLSSLLLILVGSVACYIVSELTHPGEQSAKLMLPDTDGYFTVNLRPGISQSLEFKRLLDSFLTDPTIDNQIQDLQGQLEDEWGINFEDEVLPWLGPEVALGTVWWPGMFEADKGPWLTILVGTSDREASRVVLQKWLAKRVEHEGITLSTETYREVEITIVSHDGGHNEYYAITSEYIVVGLSGVTLDRIHQIIDLSIDGGASLWDNPNFQDALTNLPGRMGMGYFDVAHFLGLVGDSIDNPADMAVFNALTPYAPSFISASFSCVDKGIKFHFYSPTAAEWDFIADQQNPLSITNLLPGDALGFYGDQNLKAWWDEALAVLSSFPRRAAGASSGLYVVEGIAMEPTFHHGDRVLVFPLTGVLERGDVVVFTSPQDPNVVMLKRIVGLPGENVEITGGIVYVDGVALEEPYIAEPPSYSFGPEVVPEGEYFLLGDNRNQSNDSHNFGFVPLANIQGKVAVNIDADIVSWMTGEFAVAALPTWGQGPGPAGEGPALLGLFQIADQGLVQSHIEKIIDGVRSSGGQVDVHATTIAGVPATLLDIEGSMKTPTLGYLFLGDFLVAGTSEEALAAVVNAYQDPGLSLTQSAKYQKMSAFLPASKTGLIYADPPQIVDFILSIPEVNPQDRQGYFDFVAPWIEPLQGLGFSYFVGVDDFTLTLALHVERVFTTHYPYPNPDSDEMVAVQAQILGGTGVQQAELLWSVDGTPQFELAMYDDGAHGDKAAGDGIYGVQIGPFAAGSLVSYQVRVTDVDADTILAPAYPRSFQSLEPLVATGDILVVVDDTDTSAAPEYTSPYTDALDAMSLSYDLWDASLRGAPDENELAQYLNGAVIWGMPWSGYLVHGLTRDQALAALQSYLDAGGALFMSGRNVAAQLQSQDFLADYLHAVFIKDNVGLWRVLGVAGDPISDGLSLSLDKGGVDEIAPVAPAVTIFTYDPSATYPGKTARLGQSVPEPGERYVPGNVIAGLQAVVSRLSGVVSRPGTADGEEESRPAETATVGEVNSRDIIPSGTAGLRVDTGTYKVVYLAFGFEAIDTPGARAEVMKRVLEWLAPESYGTWQVHLSAEATVNSAPISDPDNFAGAALDAAEGWDSYDAPNPPPSPPPSVDVYFPHLDWPAPYTGDYSRDIRPPADMTVWNFHAVAHGFSGNVTLSWDISQVPGRYQSVMLQDAATGEYIDMRSQGGYTFSASAEVPREFNFILAMVANLSTTLQPGWNMFSFPLQPDPANWDSQIGDDIAPLYVFHYDTSQGGYKMYPTNPLAMGAGLGYWAKVFEPTEVDVQGYLIPEAPYRVHLLPGWNQIGLPRTYPVSWGGVQVDYGGTVVDLLTAHANTWVAKYLYWYDPAPPAGYEIAEAPGGMLWPWMGYWVKSYVEADLLVPAAALP